ncbi:hypothetical protein DFH08DRAFT_827094 [Mycena albidolilacea]|uniref:Uncharacterized protein n=1 Tax=Mycena albidolilacea TaxID=1033008 RepID=A0AAD7E7L7_9AGAR|nr:hypothetical protein DFH08DRAFT_827094 [Mycena albidolilacea]
MPKTRVRLVHNLSIILVNSYFQPSTYHQIEHYGKPEHHALKQMISCVLVVPVRIYIFVALLTQRCTHLTGLPWLNAELCAVPAETGRRTARVLRISDTPSCLQRPVFGRAMIFYDLLSAGVAEQEGITLAGKQHVAGKYSKSENVAEETRGTGVGAGGAQLMAEKTPLTQDCLIRGGTWLGRQPRDWTSVTIFFRRLRRWCA